LTEEPAQTSFTATAFLGRRLWKNAGIYFNPEVAGGSGLSKALGIAGFVNGETFRIGSPQLKLYLARLFFEQKFALGNETTFDEDDLNQLQGKTPAKYISVRIGKYSLADFFDDVEYSHDPRTQFFNWSLMSNGAWDYPANTRGYTEGIVAEYHTPKFAARFSVSALPKVANGPDLDLDFSQSIGLVAEVEKNYFVNSLKGTVRFLLIHNKTHMDNYNDAVKASPVNPDITSVREYGHTKSGFGISWEQQLSNTLGAFVRLGWNDGKNVLI
jgi:high affinity Mn2+ porin